MTTQGGPLQPQYRPMYRGDNLVFESQVQAPPVIVPGQNIQPVPEPITGWKFYFTCKLYLSDPDSQAVYQTTSLAGGNIVILNAAAGIIQVTMPGTATANFPDTPVDCAYDVKAFDSSGRPFTIEAGSIRVFPNATRAQS